MKLILGTVQFGLPYGVTNTEGKPTSASVFNTLDLAWKSGIRILDTAQSYGSANELIAMYHAQRDHRFGIINKVADNLKDISHVATRLKIEAQAMDIEGFEGLMFHNALNVPSDISPDFFEEIAANLNIGVRGLSLNDVHEFPFLDKKFEFQLVQLPLNALNAFFTPLEFLKSLKKTGVQIHARSAFMQGILLADPTSLPWYLEDLEPTISNFQKDCEEAGISRLAGCLMFLLQNRCIDFIVVGAQNALQLEELIMSYAQAQEALEKGINMDWPLYAVKNPELVSPVSWLKFQNDTIAKRST